MSPRSTKPLVRRDRTSLFDRYRQQGFTLIEMAVVIAIIGLLLGAVLTPLATQLEVRKNRETERLLREVKQALIGYAIANGRLPCPDFYDPDDNDPLEDPSVLDGEEDCDQVYGTPATIRSFLPWRELELRPTDAWGNVFGYHVTREFTRVAVTGAPADTDQLDLTDVGNITINTRGDNPAAGAGGEGKEIVPLATTAPVVVISFGANGLDGYTIDAEARATPELDTFDESENGDNDGTYISRLHSPGGLNCDEDAEDQIFCEYDDLLIWISRSVLIGEMVNAGRLP